MNQNDPFAYIIELCCISPSQEEILRNCPFVGETVNLHEDEATSSLRGMPVASDGIAMASLAETPQEGGKDSSGPQDIFHTPPEESSLPTSGDQLWSVDFDRCTVNQAIDIDDETLGFADLSGYAEAAEFVDLSDDSKLGFPDLKLRQRIDCELVAECSRDIDGAGVSEISRSALNKFRVLERELSLQDGLGELPLKKMKFSEQNSGFDSLHGIESQKVGEDMGNCKRKLVSNTENPCNFGADPQPQHNVLIAKETSLGIDDDENACGGTSVDKKSGSRENLGSHVIQLEIAKSAGNWNFYGTGKSVKNSESREGICACTGEGNESTDEVVETSEWQKRADEQPVSPVLPSSIRGCLENAAKKSGSGEGNISVFDVLKVLKENSDEDTLANVSLWKVTKINGITFPRPWWRNKEGNC